MGLKCGKRRTHKVAKASYSPLLNIPDTSTEMSPGYLRHRSSSAVTFPTHLLLISPQGTITLVLTVDLEAIFGHSHFFYSIFQYSLHSAFDSLHFSDISSCLMMPYSAGVYCLGHFYIPSCTQDESRYLKPSTKPWPANPASSLNTQHNTQAFKGLVYWKLVNTGHFLPAITYSLNPYERLGSRQAWRLTPEIPAHRRLKQKDCSKFKISLSYR